MVSYLEHDTVLFSLLCYFHFIAKKASVRDALVLRDRGASGSEQQF